MSNQDKHLYEFGPFRLDSSERLLWRDGQPVAIPPIAFDTLLALVERHGQLVTKDSLLRLVWPDSFVEEGNLTNNISILRKALGEGTGGHRYIETLPRRGYRFVAAVKEMPEEVIVKERTRTRVVIDEGEISRRGERTSGAESTAGEEGRQQQRKKRSLQIMAAIIIGVGLASLVLILVKANKPRQPVASGTIRSLAVLPFKPLVAEDRNESFEIGIADTLINTLGGIRGVAVRPISAVRKYAGIEQDPIAAGREQGVEAVLDGSVQWEGQRVRVTWQLLSVADGAVIWSDKCEDQCTDIFAVQDSISRHIVSALALKLSGEEQKLLAKRYTDNREAYKLYIRGRYFIHKLTLDGIKNAKESYEQAIDLDPTYALAYAGLADWYMTVGGSPTMTVSEAMPRAESLAERALELDETLAEAHTTVGLCKLLYRWDWAAAERALKRALDLRPNSPDCIVNYAMYLMAMRRFDDALVLQKRAWELDPLSEAIGVGLAGMNLTARNYDEAIRQYYKLIEMNPDSGLVYYYLARAYQQKEMCEEALASYQKQQTILGNQELVEAMGKAREASGCDQAIKLLIRHWVEASKEALRKGVYFPSAHINNYALAGDKDKVIYWLEKAFEERHPLLLELYSPTYDGLRSDPRFNDIVRRVGLPQ